MECSIIQRHIRAVDINCKDTKIPVLAYFFACACMSASDYLVSFFLYSAYICAYVYVRGIARTEISSPEHKQLHKE